MGRILSTVAVLALGLCSHVISPVHAQSAVVAPVAIDRAGWKVTADAQQSGNLAGAAIDGDRSTFWHSQYSPSLARLPHTFTIDMQSRYVVNGFTYLPRQDGSNNGNIGGHNISVSLDNVTWTAVASGTWNNDKTIKTSFFTPRPARFVRLIALTEAQGANNQWSSASEFTVLKTPHSTLSRQAWKVSADSEEKSTANSYNATDAIDGAPTTYWHSQWRGTPPPLPHYFTIDQGSSKAVAGLTYLPRPPSTGANGNIGGYRVESSTDGSTWSLVCTGTWPDNNNLKTTEFAKVTARYFRLVATSEAGNRGPWASASEINLLDGGVQLQNFKVTVDSQETTAANNSGIRAMDGDPASFWHTSYSGTAAPLPHTFTIDMLTTYPVKALHYTPRQDGNKTGNIGNHSIAISLDGTSWTRVAQGAFFDDAKTKLVNFQETPARYVRLTAFSEAGNRGPYSSAAEISVDFDTTFTAPAPNTLGQWGNMVNFPIVPVAAALLPNGKLLTWSSQFADSFGGGSGSTLTATYDPATGYVTQQRISNTAHDMFCPGLSIDFNGRPFVTGGNNAPRTSIYDALNDTWISGPNMQISRGYQASQTLSDGRIFTIGGSWSGNSAQVKDGEVYSMANGSWSKLPGCPVKPMLTADADDAQRGSTYRADNHGWFFAWSNATVLQAGPSQAMHWYSTTNGGGIRSAGSRTGDVDAMNGNAVMYDAVAGKILTLGGGTSYQLVSASTTASVLTVGAPNATVQVTLAGNMHYRRAFHNSKVLPDGSVFIVGGQEYPNPFYDDESILYPELWSPSTNTFTVLAPMVVPRTYHSVAILLPDATIFSGGGGLCAGCSQNHFDGQIFSPPYLFAADGAKASRPVISSADSSVKVGATLSVTTGSSVASFALIRLGSATHTVDTDQRRIPLAASGSGPSYSLKVPSDPGVALPGYYMLFALDSAGVPSVAKMVQVQPVAPVA